VLLIKQLRDDSKTRSNYIDLLKADVDENPKNAKTRFYYARELGIHLNYTECIAQFDKCLEIDELDRCNKKTQMTKSEISFVCITKARCLDIIGDHINAKIWFDISCTLCPESRDPFVYYALSCCRHSEWELCFSLILKALSIEKRELLYTDEPYHWESKPWYLASIAAWNLGKIDEARKYGTIALEYTIDPADNEITPWIYYYALMCCYNSEWPSCYVAAVKCVNPVVTLQDSTDKERDFAAQIFNLIAISSWNMGNKKIAIKYGEIASNYDPNNENIKNNYIFYTIN
jgi:tetratricopeptide (TPR) repeat protein